MNFEIDTELESEQRLEKLKSPFSYGLIKAVNRQKTNRITNM